MNEQKCQLIYQQLINMLENTNMEWVIQLASEEIITGKIIQTKSRAKASLQLNLFNEYEESSRASKKGTPDIEVREYTSKEKLKILINCIEQTIVDTRLMEGEVINFFRNSVKSNQNLNPNIIFTSDLPDLDRNKSFFITPHGLDKRVEQAKALHELLKELKEKIDNDT